MEKLLEEIYKKLKENPNVIGNIQLNNIPKYKFQLYLNDKLFLECEHPELFKIKYDFGVYNSSYCTQFLYLQTATFQKGIFDIKVVPTKNLNFNDISNDALIDIQYKILYTNTLPASILNNKDKFFYNIEEVFREIEATRTLQKEIIKKNLNKDIPLN